MKKPAHVLKHLGVMGTLLVLLGLIPTHAQAEVAIVGTGGFGLFAAQDKDYYSESSTGIYSEIGVALDVSIVRLGFKIGYIFQSVGVIEVNDRVDTLGAYTLSYLPVQGEILFSPFRGQAVTPYAGLMVGAFIPTGDNDYVLPAISPKFGLEMNLEPIFVYGDIRYTYAPYSDLDINAGGFTIVLGMGLRLGLGR